MQSKSEKRLQLFLQFPNSQIKTLTLHPFQTLTLETLKRSFMPTNNNLLSFFFTLNGKPINDNVHMPNLQITHLSTLVLHSQLLGGGGDGGATGAESRDCYLNMYADKKPDKVDPNEQRLSKWLNCSLSNEALTPPCVIDRLGNVFNKESLVEALIGKKLPKGFSYIKGLKDMIDVKLELIPGGEGASGAKFQCPITGLEFNGKYRFFALRNCGHVLSAKALKEVKSSSCLVCYKEFEESDKIPINGTEEEVEVLMERLLEERTKIKDKKSKKVKNGDMVTNGNNGVGLELPRVSGKKHGIDGDKGVEKVAGKVEGNNKIVENVKSASNGSTAKKFKAVDVAPAGANKEVYASIFTSSKKSDFKETFTCRSLPLGRN